MLTDYGVWSAFSGVADADQTSIDSICAQVDAAIKRLCRPWLFEAQAFANVILDAPVDDTLELPQFPVRAVSSLYRRLDANGNVALFTSDFLLTNYKDYLLDIDDPVDNYSKTAFVRQRQGQDWSSGCWGYEMSFSPGRLTGRVVPARGAIMVSFAAGCLIVPDDVKLAANLAVSLIYQRRQHGMPVTSNSWNGEAVSFAGPYTAVGVLESPDIADLLMGYRSVVFAKA